MGPAVLVCAEPPGRCRGSMRASKAASFAREMASRACCFSRCAAQISFIPGSRVTYLRPRELSETRTAGVVLSNPPRPAPDGAVAIRGAAATSRRRDPSRGPRRRRRGVAGDRLGRFGPSEYPRWHPAASPRPRAPRERASLGPMGKISARPPGTLGGGSDRCSHCHSRFFCIHFTQFRKTASVMSSLALRYLRGPDLGTVPAHTRGVGKCGRSRSPSQTRCSRIRFPARPRCAANARNVSSRAVPAASKKTMRSSVDFWDCFTNGTKCLSACARSVRTRTWPKLREDPQDHARRPKTP